LDERSGADGVIWEPLVLTAFVLAAALTGASSPVAWTFEETDPVSARTDPATPPAVYRDAGVLSSPAPVDVVVRAVPSTREADAPSAVEPAERAREIPRADRALISWWNEERWESRDQRAEAWRRDWLRIARTRPERVPLELWVSILGWAPDDPRLVRSAARAADRHSPRRRGGWRTGPDDDQSRVRADVVAQIDRAVREAGRRADYENRGRDRGEKSWYRSLLSRIRGGGDDNSDAGNQPG